jgi:hypothetical protein
VLLVPLLLSLLQMAAGFRKVRKYFDMLDLNGDRVIDMREFTSQVRQDTPLQARQTQLCWLHFVPVRASPQ